MFERVSVHFKAGYPASSNLSEFKEHQVISPFSWYPTTISSDFSYYWCFLLLLHVLSSPFNSLLLSNCWANSCWEPFTASLYIIRSFHQSRGEQHSGRVHSSLLRYISLLLMNAQHFTVTHTSIYMHLSCRVKWSENK